MARIGFNLGLARRPRPGMCGESVCCLTLLDVWRLPWRVACLACGADAMQLHDRSGDSKDVDSHAELTRESGLFSLRIDRCDPSPGTLSDGGIVSPVVVQERYRREGPGGWRSRPEGLCRRTVIVVLR